VFGDDRRAGRRLREGVSAPYGVSFVSSRTVTRYATQVKTNVSKIVPFLSAGAVFPLPAGARGLPYRLRNEILPASFRSRPRAELGKGP
jgi:hypothetical protein